MSVTLPRDRAIAPPGRYMLFLVDERGIPSVGNWVEVSEPGDVTAT